MAKAKTHFEQVPIQEARAILRDESRSPHSTQVACAICGSSVALEQCKFDEAGRAVHDDCYFGKLARPTPLTQKPQK